MLTIALGFLMLGIGGYAFVETAWQGFLAAAVVGIGNGAFWPSQSSLLSGLSTREQRPAVFAMQRVTMNLGIGIGGLAGGLIAAESFRALFLARRAHVRRATRPCSGSFVPEPRRPRSARERSGSYRDVFRHRVFMGLMLVNALFIAAGMAQLEVLPAYAKNEAGIGESRIGQLFFINTLAVVLLQLPIARLARGHRRMTFLAAARPRLGGLVAAGSGKWPLALRRRRVRPARRRDRALRRRRVPARSGAGAARRRSRRPQHDRAVHGDLGALLAGRLHDRPGRRAARCSTPRRPGSGSSPRSAACSRAPRRSRWSAACPRAFAARRTSRHRARAPVAIVDAASPEWRRRRGTIGAMPTLEDPLSTYAQPAPHPADTVGLRRGPGRRAR